MASERMRILIRKFELSSTAISSRCLAALGSPEILPDCSQSHFGKILRIFFFSFPPLVRLVRPECPGEPRNAPRLQPEPFWENTTDFFSFPPRSAQPRDSKKGLSECLAFLTHTQNYFEQYYVFCSHP